MFYNNKKILLIENFIASLIYDIANGLLTGARYLLNHLRRLDRIKCIVLFRTGSLGDMVCAMPVFRAVRKHFSTSQLILLTNQSPFFSNPQPLSSLIGKDIFDEIIYYQSKDLKRPGKVYLLLKLLRQHRIDIMIYLGQSDFGFFRQLRDLSFFYLCGCKRLYGFRLDKHRIFRIAQRYYRKFDNQYQRLMKTLRTLGISEDRPDFSLPITDTDKQFIDSIWSKHPNLNSHRIIVIHGALGKYPVKDWPKENFLKLAKALVNEYNAFIILIGGKEVREICRFIENNLQDNCLNLCGETSFMQTAELISRSELLISCDSGPLHLAAAVHKPVVGIYSAIDYPNCWYPFGENHIIIRHDVPCQVCSKIECQTMECIKGISIEEVLIACREVLSHNLPK